MTLVSLAQGTTRLTLPTLSGFSSYQDLRVNRSSGMGDQESLPARHRSHSLEGLVASPAKRQLMPTMAMGNSACDSNVEVGCEATFPLEKEWGWPFGTDRESECTTMLLKLC
jgi:hypothetical protein